jgi:hypothetical protein
MNLLWLAAVPRLAVAAPPVQLPLSTIFGRAARIKIVNVDTATHKTEVEMTDRQAIQAIGQAIGEDQAGGAGDRRRCGDQLQLTFLDGMGTELGHAGFCGTGGLYAEKAGEKPLSGPEFTYASGGRAITLPMRIADPTALLARLRAVVPEYTPAVSVRPGPRPLSSVLSATARIEVIARQMPYTVITDGDQLRRIGVAIGAAQDNSGPVEQCDHNATVNFKGRAREDLGTLRFCSGEGLSDNASLRSPEFEIGHVRGGIKIADAAALLHLLRPQGGAK